MAEKELVAARAQVEMYKSDFGRNTGLLKERLKPANLAFDAWHTVRDTGMKYSGKGVKAASDRPGAAGGAVAAIVLFLLRKPVAHLLGLAFGNKRRVPGTVQADILHASKEYDLTAPVVATNQGA